MPSEENFAALKDLKRAAQALRLAATAVAQSNALLHQAFDRGVKKKLPEDQTNLLKRMG
jgi:hypothetical protein